MSPANTPDAPKSEKARAAPMSLVRTSGKTLPVLMIERALGPTDTLKFLQGKAICALILVKSSDWIEPVAAAAKLVAHWADVVHAPAARRTLKETVDEALEGLAAGKRILFVFPTGYPVPLKLTAAADVTLKVDEIHYEDIVTAIRIVTETPKAKIGGIDTDELELGTAMQAIRPGTTPASCIRRLRSACKMPDDVDHLIAAAPELKELHGYGPAREWADRLVIDLDLWRGGKLDFGRIQRNAVLAGPPGVGKSTFMRSLAKSTGLPLFASSLGTMFASSPGYLDSVVKAIDALFAQARAAGPSAIVFIDELEGFPDRSALRGRDASWWTPVVNHLLTVLDSALSSDASGLIVVGATNHPDRLDPALVRPGRFDRIIEVALPGRADLAGIYRQHLHGELPDADLEAVASAAAGSTGADVVGHVKGAHARARSAGRPVRLADLMDEICSPSTLSPEAQWRVCVHESGHALAAFVLATAHIESVAIRSRNGSGGQVVYSHQLVELAGREELRNIATQCLAGRAAEEVLLGAVSAGAGGRLNSDLAKASGILATSRLSLGLGSSLVYMAEPQDALAAARRSPALLRSIGAELQELYGSACELIRENRAAVHRLATVLMEERVLSGDRVRSILTAEGLMVGERLHA